VGGRLHDQEILPQEKSCRIPLTGGLGGFHFRSARFGEEKTLLLLTGIQVMSFGFPVHISVNLHFIEGATV